MIAVIGATGFTGKRVVSALRAANPRERIVAVVRETSDRHSLDDLNTEIRVADLGGPSGLRLALRGATSVVCTASLGSGYGNNICLALLDAAPDQAVLFSTTSIFTRIPSSSHATRVQAEQLIRDSGIPATIVRPTMIYGRPGDRNVERLLRFIKRSPAVPIVGRGRALQQPVHVDDVAGAIVGILRRPEQTLGRAYNLAGPRPFPFTALVRMCGAAVGRRALLIPVPPRVARLAVSAWSRSGRWPRVSPEQIQRIVEDKSFSWSSARQDFGYVPRGFGSGVVEEARLLGLQAGLVARDFTRGRVYGKPSP